MSQSWSDKHFRKQRAFTLLTLLATGLVMSGLFKMIQLTREGPIQDAVSIYEHRLAGVKMALPKKGTLGYLSYPPLTDLMADRIETQKYFLSVYVLSPVLLDYQHDHQLYLGNFEEGVPPGFLEAQRLLVVQDFGNGVLLLKKGAH
ncbi:MAG: hypothetical protein HY774_27655 [Acidobacteria bacterium]|nr:hypothetical protein [Acidobacteriota bacterium]